MQQEIEEVEKDIVEFQEEAKKVVKVANEAKEEKRDKEGREKSSAEGEIQQRVIELLLEKSQTEDLFFDRQIWDCFNEIMLSRAEISPQDQMRAFIPKNKAEAALKEATLLRYKLEDFVAKHPEAAELCSKIFVGAMYGLQGIEYAVAGALGGPLGIAAKFATQESTAWAIDTTIEESSNKAAKLITQSEALQREFAGTMKLCTYASLCTGSVKAGKKLVSSLTKSTIEKTPFNLTRYGGPGGGHHIHMKKAYESHPLYDLNEALCLSNEEMMRLGINHLKVTTEQRRLCIQLNKSGKTLTREEMNRISVEALVAGGASEQLARDIVAKSQWDLRIKGIRNPTNQPFMRNRK